MEYDNSNRGAIWKNDKKETEKHPDFTGEHNVTIHNGMTNYKNEVIVDDIEKYLIKDATGKVTGFKMDFYVNAWKRKPGASEKTPALSFTLSPKNKQSAKADSGEMFPNNIVEDDLPF